MHKPLLGIWIALALATSGQAKNIYVAPGGRDTDAGTLGSPFATLAKAAASSAPGDTILIRGGTYKLTTQLEPKSGSSEQARITYKAFGGESVLVDGQSGYCATLASRAYLSFDGLKFTTSDIDVGAGMFYFEDSRHIDFRNCEFYGMPAQVGGENSAVIRCMSSGWPDTAFAQNSDSCTFRNNNFHDNASPAFRLYDTKGWIIENNKFNNCLQAVGGKDEPYDMLVRRNLIIGGDLAFYFALQGGGNGVTITENIVINTAGGFMIGGLGTYDRRRLNVNVFNNTFVDVQTAFYGWSDNQFDSAVKIWNNIVYATTAANIPAGADIGSRFICLNKYGNTPTDPNNYSIDYNDYSMPASDRSTWFIDGGKGANTLTSWNTAHPSFDAHSLSANPLFVSEANANFHLLPNSPCKAAGKTGEDLGAYPHGDDGTVIGLLPKTTTAVHTSHPRPHSAGPSWAADGRQLGATVVPGIVLGNGGRVTPRH